MSVGQVVIFSGEVRRISLLKRIAMDMSHCASYQLSALSQINTLIAER